MNVIEKIYTKARRELIPLGVHFDLTYRCHQRCIHCYIPESWRRGEGPGPELTTAQVKSILDQLAKAGTFFLTFSGGEIFMRPDLFDLLEYARKLNFSISLMTSGTLGLSREEIRELKHIGIASMHMSLYSIEHEVQDQITGVPGSGRLALQTIEDCRAQGFLIIANSFILSINAGSVSKLKSYASQEDLRIRFDCELSPRWDGSSHPLGLALGTKEREHFYNEIDGEEWSKQKEEPLTLAQNLPSKGCGAGLDRCYLSPTGDLWPCIEISHVCGRMGIETEFSQLWQESARLNQLRRVQESGQLEERLCDFLRKQGP
jgi:AdoMet-dependent heme synthase